MGMAGGQFSIHECIEKVFTWNLKPIYLKYSLAQSQQQTTTASRVGRAIHMNSQTYCPVVGWVLQILPSTGNSWLWYLGEKQQPKRGLRASAGMSVEGLKANWIWGFNSWGQSGLFECTLCMPFEYMQFKHLNSFMLDGYLDDILFNTNEYWLHLSVIYINIYF